MENTLAEGAPKPHRRRRRSHGKSSKTKHDQRKRLKRIGLWLLIGLIGGIIVAGIAVIAGRD
jgi:hypothetical protein